MSVDVERWREISEVFEAALDVAAAERPAWLAGRCGDDRELAAEVAAMLAADAQASLLERPASEAAGLAPPPLWLPAPGSRVGRYEVQAAIGRGGFGDVYRGWDPDLARPVAIKVCPWARHALRARFAREAAIAARLDHPGITRVYDIGIEAGTPYLVQELLAGHDLGELLAVDPAAGLDAAMRLDLLHQLAAALAYAHRHGVVHRDIKPANLRVLPTGQLKVMDFGIAFVAEGASQLTASGEVLGTAAYMAPEQIRGEAVDARADLYAWGAVAFHLFAGEPPFPGAGPAVLYRILEEAPPRLGERAAECPPRLAAIVARCLAKPPGDRFASADDLLAALAAVAPGPAEARSRTWRATLWRRRLWLGLTAVGLALATLLLVPPRGSDPAPPGGGAAGAAAAHAPAPAPGRLRIDARPWAEVVTIIDAEGRELEPAVRFTPVAVELPPGDYTVTLRHPRAGTGNCTARLEAGGQADCRAVLEHLDARRFVTEAGW